MLLYEVREVGGSRQAETLVVLLQDFARRFSVRYADSASIIALKKRWAWGRRLSSPFELQ